MMYVMIKIWRQKHFSHLRKCTIVHIIFFFYQLLQLNTHEIFVNYQLAIHFYDRSRGQKSLRLLPSAQNHIVVKIYFLPLISSKRCSTQYSLTKIFSKPIGMFQYHNERLLHELLLHVI